MDRLCREGFVLADRTELQVLGDGFQKIEGALRCHGALYVSVDKRLRTWRDGDGVMWCQVVHYDYNCIVGKLGALRRFNSPHDHRPHYHVHARDVLAGEQEETVAEIALTEWPLLTHVVHWFRGWYYDNLESLQQRGLV
jgi:hypothetical protein